MWTDLPLGKYKGRRCSPTSSLDIVAKWFWLFTFLERQHRPFNVFLRTLVSWKRREKRFFLYIFVFFLCIVRTSAAPQRPAHGTVPSQVATHLRTDRVCRVLGRGWLRTQDYWLPLLLLPFLMSKLLGPDFITISQDGKNLFWSNSQRLISMRPYHISQRWALCLWNCGHKKNSKR